MNAAIVVDVGNTRMKWGRCQNRRVTEVVSLASDDPAAWQQQWLAWGSPGGVWAISGSNPPPIAQLRDWLLGHQQRPLVFDDYRQLDLKVAVDHPDQVGMDRLFNALAVKHRGGGKGPAAIVDAGSAVTVDLLDQAGVFRGGAIFPGLRLMARALHDYTAKLPVVDITEFIDPPGTNTAAALRTGIGQAVLGGIDAVLRIYETRWPVDLRIYLGGGDAALVADSLSWPVTLWPEMTLEGIRAQVDGQSDFVFDDDEP